MHFMGLECSVFKKILDSRNYNTSNSNGVHKNINILDNVQDNQSVNKFIEIIDENIEGSDFI